MDSHYNIIENVSQNNKHYFQTWTERKSTMIQLFRANKSHLHWEIIKKVTLKSVGENTERNERNNWKDRTKKEADKIQKRERQRERETLNQDGKQRLLRRKE